jgi:hypothetical protein
MSGRKGKAEKKAVEKPATRLTGEAGDRRPVRTRFYQACSTRPPVKLLTESTEKWNPITPIHNPDHP